MSLPDIDVAKLCAAVQRARLVLRKPREIRMEITRQYVGSNYSEEGASLSVPANMVAMYSTIVGHKLVANNPRALLTTDDRRIKPVVESMMAWVNRQIVKTNLVETLQRAVFDSLFSLGIIKVALADPGQAATLGWQLKAGEPFAEVVDLDDFVYDVHARRFDQCSFMGHRYRIPLKAANEIYGKKADLSPSEDAMFNQEGDERISVISRTTLAGQDEFEEMVDLWEFYLPRHRLIVTLRDSDVTGAGGEPLEVKPWLGPTTGPYHILAMNYVPGNAMPKGPLQDLIDLHLTINRTLRQLIKQAARQKSLTLVAKGADADGTRVMESNDGDMPRVENPENVLPAEFGGPNQLNFQFFVAMKDLFSWLSGNLDILGGLSPQSKTATQDKMLQENSSATISDMQSRAVAHAASVVKALCWYWYHDPNTVMTTTYSLPGMPQVTAEQKVYPSGPGEMARNHDFEAMSISVDPYSMQYRSPGQRLQEINQIVQTIIAPLMPVLQQQGVQFDIQSYLAKIAKLGDQPDLLDIVKMATPPEQDGEIKTPEAPGKPANTSREYLRRSVGGASDHGKGIASGNSMNMEVTRNHQTNGVKRA